MQLSDSTKKMIKIFILAFLCTEMQTKHTNPDSCRLGYSNDGGIGIGIGIGMGSGDSDGIYKVATEATYHASIRLAAEEYKHYYGRGHICSGALIAPSVVLTSDSCVFSEERRRIYHPSELRVVLGNTQRFVPSNDGLISSVTHVYRSSDIAMLLLDRDVPSAWPIPLAAALPKYQIPNDEPTNLPNAPAQWMVTSWGMADSRRHLHELISIKTTPSTTTTTTTTTTTPNIDDKDEDEDNDNDNDNNDENSYHLTESLQMNDIELILDIGAPLVNSNGLLGLRIADNRFVNVAQHLDWIQKHMGDGTQQDSSIWGIFGFLIFTAYVIKKTPLKLV